MLKKIIKFLFPAVPKKIAQIKKEIISENQKTVLSESKRISAEIKEVAQSLAACMKKIEVVSQRIDSMDSCMRLERRYNELRFWSLFKDANETEKNARKRFFRSLPQAAGFLRIFQNANVALLRALKKICDENCLRYWLYGGTLLGAVRNNGFVPWDDDIDVGMLREDIEKLIEIVRDSDSLRISSVFDWYAKCHQLRLMPKDESLPCFVDIFFFDYKKGDLEIIWDENIANHQKIIGFFDSDTSESTAFWKKNPYINKCMNEAVFSYINKKFSEYIPTDYGDDSSNNEFVFYGVDNCFTDYGKNYLDVTELFPLVELEFEGVAYSAPKAYEKYLQRIYGNIWELPKDLISHFEHVPHDELATDAMQKKLNEFIEE